jgi:ankyrin repeat protein
LKQKINVNVPQSDGATALHWAVHWDDVALADLLIRAGASVSAANDLGVTSLALACGNGNPQMVEVLLRAGANANAVATGEPVLMTAARSGSVEVVRALIARGADVNAKDSSRGQTALMWAVAHRHAEVVRVLIDHGAVVHARSRVDDLVVQRGSRYGGVVSRERAVSERAVVAVPQGGSTPLLFAARSGDLASARLLVAAGANVNDAAPDGTSALVTASHSGHGALAAFLVDRGADANAAGSGYTALHAAVLRGDLDLVTRLAAHGADLNRPVTMGTPSRRYSKDFALNQAWIGATPFWLAARFSEVEIMRVLSANGADPLVASRDETTPLIAVLAAGVDSGPSASDSRERRLDPEDLAKRAAERDEHERHILQAVELAVGLGADLNAVNYVGDTALHHAAAKGFNRVIQFLVDKGARLDMKNKRAQTPLSLTMRGSRLEGDGPALQSTAELLRKLGAKE